jgi:hypothetical protein
MRIKAESKQPKRPLRLPDRECTKEGTPDESIKRLQRIAVCKQSFISKNYRCAHECMEMKQQVLPSDVCDG